MSPQYYQLKHGFHAVLAEWQLAKLRPVFRLERLAISPTTFSTPPFLSINWETVAHHNLTQVNTVYTDNICHHFCKSKSEMKLQFWMINISISHLQGRAWGVWEPNTEFHDNIKIYRYNKFLNIGESIQIPNGVTST